jgi:hypothetical protein
MGAEGSIAFLLLIQPQTEGDCYSVPSGEDVAGETVRLGIKNPVGMKS